MPTLQLLIRIDYRLYTPSPSTLRRIPLGDLARRDTKAGRFLEDIGVLIGLLAANRYVYSDEANQKSRVAGEWIARTAALLGLADKLVLRDTRRRNHIAIYRSDAARALAQKLRELDAKSKGAAAIAAALLCPETTIHRALAPLLVGTEPRDSLSKSLALLKNSNTLWLCSFTPCVVIDGDEETARPSRRIGEGPLRAVYALDTRVLPIVLATAIGLAAPTPSGGLTAPLKGPRWASRYLEAIYGDSEAATALLEAFRAAATGAYEKATQLLDGTNSPPLRAAARAADTLCGRTQ